MDAIKIEHLSKYYGKVKGIDDLSFTVNKGDFFGFIGPNGAGKSTTIRTLLGLIKPTSGNASIFGRNISQEKEAILSLTGYLPSESTFYPGMKVRDILNFSAQLRKKDCSTMSELLCKRLQLDTNRKADELSFGNRKKVAIVCALQHEPELLILDEPTSGLDPLMQKEFFDILQELHEGGTTIFLSSHILSEIQHNCNRAAIIREGKLVTCDAVDRLSRTKARRIVIHGQVDLSALDGICDQKTTNDTTSFLYQGEMQLLIQALAAGQVQDLSVSEPNLDEIFMHYYK